MHNYLSIDHYRTCGYIYLKHSSGGLLYGTMLPYSGKFRMVQIFNYFV